MFSRDTWQWRKTFSTNSISLKLNPVVGFAGDPGQNWHFKSVTAFSSQSHTCTYLRWWFPDVHRKINEQLKKLSKQNEKKTLHTALNIPLMCLYGPQLCRVESSCFSRSLKGHLLDCWYPDYFPPYSYEAASQDPLSAESIRWFSFHRAQYSSHLRKRALTDAFRSDHLGSSTEEWRIWLVEMFMHI